MDCDTDWGSSTAGWSGGYTLELCDCGSSARKVKLSSFGTGNNKEGIIGEAQSSLY